MFKVKGIVPGCVVNYCPKGGVREEASVFNVPSLNTDKLSKTPSVIVTTISSVELLLGIAFI